MEERILKKLAIICSVAGLILLFFISSQISPPGLEIGEITIDDVGTTISACGLVESLRTSKGHIFFELKDDSGSIKSVMFNKTAEKIGDKIKPNEQVCVTGAVDEYPKGSGELEIIVKSVRP